MDEIRYDIPFEILLSLLARHPQGVDLKKPCGMGGIAGIISRQLRETPLPPEFPHLKRNSLHSIEGLSGINGNYDLMEMMSEECPWLAERIPGSRRRTVL